MPDQRADSNTRPALWARSVTLGTAAWAGRLLVSPLPFHHGLQLREIAADGLRVLGVCLRRDLRQAIECKRYLAALAVGLDAHRVIERGSVLSRHLVIQYSKGVLRRELDLHLPHG